MKKRYWGLIIGLLFPLISSGLIIACSEFNAGDVLLIIIGIFNSIAFIPGHIVANVISPDVPFGIVVSTACLFWAVLGFLFGFFVEKLTRSNRDSLDTKK